MNRNRSVHEPAALEAGQTVSANDVCVFPASFAQQRLWFLNQLDPEDPSYHIPFAFRLRGRLHIQVFERSLREMIKRHEILRTAFSVRNGEPVQVVVPEMAVRIPIHELSTSLPCPLEVQIQKAIRRDVERPFDLSRGPLFRMQLLRLNEEEHILSIIMHHIISDGWSVGILFREISALYKAAVIGKPCSLPEIPIQYADFAIWQQNWLQGEVLNGELAFWRNQLADAPRLLELPTDYPRPSRWTYEGARQSLILSKTVTEALGEFSRKEKVTPFMTLLAVFAIQLYRYTGQDDILIGTPVANRNRPEIEGLIGFFVNTLIIRICLSGTPSFREVLSRVREGCLGAYDHQDLPFEKLVEELKPDRQLNQSPLIQVMFAFENEPRLLPALSDIEVSPFEVERDTAKFDLSLSMGKTTAGQVATIEYKTALFEKDTITRMLGHYRTLLEAIFADPSRPIMALPLLTEEERHQILIEWNDTKAPYPENACIHELFEDQVKRTPDNAAVVFEEQTLTYHELNCRANQLARYLQRFGVGPEVLVEICLERSPEMIVAILGVLKAGGAYVPMDPGYPRDRLHYMLRNSRPSLLLTFRRLAERLPEHHTRTICLDEDQDVIACEAEEDTVSRATAGDLAYVIYTSGSTGRPKGVMIEHRGLCNVSLASISNFGLQANSILLQHGSLGFDNSVWEIFMALLSGATLCLAGQEDLAGPGLGRLLRDRAVTHAILVPSVLATVPPTEYPALRTLLVGAESCPAELVEQWSPGRRFFNTYGPTEASIHVSLFEYRGTGRYELPIGRPISNIQFYILDRHLQPVPIGVPGELHIGGVGLARGYHNQPELTAQAFITNPFSHEPGSRLYKTGDLARYMPDGNIEFLGRIDQQVKIRGFRIEPGEIESVLRKHAAVRETVVIAREDRPGDRRLAAYVVLKQDQVDAIGELRRYLKDRLPDYMVPSVFVPLENLPLTPQGKIDRRALPVPENIRPELEQTYVAPRNHVEEVLAGIWSEILGISRIGVRDNFFDLGGHSLLATRIVSRIGETFLHEVSLRFFFEAPTIAELAAGIDSVKGRGSGRSPIKPLPRDGHRISLSRGKE